jgi:hypothetical protein
MTNKELWEEIKKKVGMESAGDVGLWIVFLVFGVFPAILTVVAVLWFFVTHVARFLGLMD